MLHRSTHGLILLDLIVLSIWKFRATDVYLSREYPLRGYFLAPPKEDNVEVWQHYFVETLINNGPERRDITDRDIPTERRVSWIIIIIWYLKWKLRTCRIPIQVENVRMCSNCQSLAMPLVPQNCITSRCLLYFYVKENAVKKFWGGKNF